MTGRGGDHELDVAAILKRAREPEGLAELRRAIESLGMDEATRSLAQILEVVHDTRQQLQGLARAIEAVASGAHVADHLVDTTRMQSYTVSFELNTEATPITIGPPDYSLGWFLAEAIAVRVIDRYIATERDAELENIKVGWEPVEVSFVPAERWRAPPGRGHPVQWRPYSDAVHMQMLSMVVRLRGVGPAVLRITLSGKSMSSPHPPGPLHPMHRRGPFR